MSTVQYSIVLKQFYSHLILSIILRTYVQLCFFVFLSSKEFWTYSTNKERPRKCLINSRPDFQLCLIFIIIPMVRNLINYRIGHGFYYFFVHHVSNVHFIKFFKISNLKIYVQKCHCSNLFGRKLTNNCFWYYRNC